MSTGALVNSLRLGNAYMHYWNGSSLVQVMVSHLFGTKPLTESTITSWQLGSKFQSMKNCHWKKCISKCYLQSGGYFVPILMCEAEDPTFTMAGLVFVPSHYPKVCPLIFKYTPFRKGLYNIITVYQEKRIGFAVYKDGQLQMFVGVNIVDYNKHLKLPILMKRKTQH